MQVNSFNNNSFLTLENNKKAAENALERISSGKNKQLDDVALALIANSLGSEISGLTQGLENANIATSLLQIADGVLSGLSQGADDLNVLALKASNPALNSSQQAIVRQEADAISSALQNSVNNASFNGQQIFGRSYDFNLGNSTVSTSIPSIDLSEYDLNSQEGIADFVKVIQESQSAVGSTINELSTSSNSISSQILALSASKSQIADADFAKEISNFNQSYLLVKAGLFVQAQSNEISAARVSSLLS